MGNVKGNIVESNIYNVNKKVGYRKFFMGGLKLLNISGASESINLDRPVVIDGKGDSF